MPRTLDHVVLCVSGLEQARKSYRALGFSLTPPATHPFGTRNSLVQLPGRNFLELLALDENGAIPPHEHPHRFSFGAHNRGFLRRRGEGMSMLALAGSDARADVEEFGSSGLVTYYCCVTSHTQTIDSITFSASERRPELPSEINILGLLVTQQYY